MTLPGGLAGHALYHFVGGRRRVNAQRHHQAIDRRYRLLFEWRKHPNMCKADLARFFGVSRSTITRDVQWLKRHFARGVVCSLCGQTRHDQNPAELTEWLSEVHRHIAMS